MKRRIAISGALIMIACTGCGEEITTESANKSSLEIDYEVQHSWPTLPDGSALGFVSAVDLDSHGHVFTFHSFRPWEIPFPAQPESEPLVLMWSAEDGTLLNSWGEGIFRMAHGLSIDSEDNVWVTDVGRSQILKFSHDGELLLTLGEDGVEAWDETHFAQPTDVEFGPDGTVYVSDGYVNCRVVGLTQAGQYRFEWGECGSGPGQFDTPHDLAVDARGRVYVADRENDRIQVFEPDGTFVSEWLSGGRWRPYGISLSPEGTMLFVIDGGEQPANFPDRSQVVILDLSGRQLGGFGRFGNQDGQFMMGHDIAVNRDGAVYVVDIIGRRVQRFIQPE